MLLHVCMNQLSRSCSLETCTNTGRFRVRTKLPRTFSATHSPADHSPRLDRRVSNYMDTVSSSGVCEAVTSMSEQRDH